MLKISKKWNIHFKTGFQIILLFFSFYLTNGVRIEELRLSKDSEGRLEAPEQFSLELQVHGKPVTLELAKNNLEIGMVPVMIGVNGKLENWTGTPINDFAVYVDSNRQASMLLQQKNDRDITRVVGSFNDGTSDFLVQPVNIGADGGNFSMQVEPYSVFELPTNVDSPSEEDQRDKSTFSQNARLFLQQLSSLSSLQTGARKRYGVEMLVVADYAIYKRWYDQSNERSADARRNDAINNIRAYFTHVVNGIDLRYRSMNEPDFEIYVRISGFFISTTVNDAPWTEGAGIRDYDSFTGITYSHAYRALDAFEDWIAKNLQSLPAHDQASLFTGNQPIGGITNGRRRRISGLADIRGICTNLSASISADQGFFAATSTGAHELAHNLGALHDNINSNQCTSKDQYIMASAPGAVTERTRLNRYTFSYCSKNFFRSWMRTLDSADTNCLTNTARRIDQNEFIRKISKPPGQIYSVFQQCQVIKGTGSTYCGGGNRDSLICERMDCYDTVTKTCSSNVESIAANGTTCGNKKWCMYGKCVYDERAPVAKDYCLYGDYIGSIGNGLTCDSIRTQPWLCYDKTHREACCATCAEIRDTSKPHCEYGNRASSCAHRSPFECYTSVIYNECCQYCDNLKNSAAIGCEYGNRANWCREDLQTILQCYDNDVTCCDVCRKNVRNIPGCKYGDRASWCVREATNEVQCRSLSQTCCQSCARFSSTPNPQTTTTISTTTSSLPTNKITVQVASSQKPTLGPITFCPHDGATWCDGLSPGLCYGAYRTCCSRCRQFYTRIPGCEFGNRVDWCSSATRNRCLTDRAYIDNCCMTCSSLLGITPQPVTSTTTQTTTTRPTTKLATTQRTTVTTTVSQEGGLGCNTLDQAQWCSDLQAFGCYASWRTCCAKCTQFYENVNECEFGDRVSWCADHATRENCKDRPDIINNCCKTCRLLMNTGSTPTTASTTTATAIVSSQQCSGPDRASWCAGLFAHQCYANDKTCCNKCKSFLVANPVSSQCIYGDRAGWCRGIQPFQCYSQNGWGSYCCQSCARYRTGYPGCEYGNRVLLCNRNIDCITAEGRRRCCGTCGPNPPIAINPLPFSTSLVPRGNSSVCRESDPDWCSVIRPYNCYQDEDTCCHTCASSAYYTGIEHCWYGDRLEWCSTYVTSEDKCNDERVRSGCCLTCLLLSANRNGQKGIIDPVAGPGVTLTLDTGSISEVVESEKLILNTVRESVQTTCKNDSSLCCTMFSTSYSKEQSTKEFTNIVKRTKSVYVKSGYPVKTSDSKTRTKLTVRVPADLLESACLGRSRVKRSSNSDRYLYIKDEFISEILNENLEFLKKQLGLDISLADQFTSSATSLNQFGSFITIIISLVLFHVYSK